MPVYLLSVSVDQVCLPAANSPQRRVPQVPQRRVAQPRLQQLMSPDLMSLRIGQGSSAIRPEDYQRRLIDLAFDCQRPEQITCHAAVADDSSLSLLLTWADGRSAERVACAASRRINCGLDAVFGGAVRLEAVTSSRRVRNRTQFEYLRDSHLPGLPGLGWNARSGFRESGDPGISSTPPTVVLGRTA